MNAPRNYAARDANEARTLEMLDQFMEKGWTPDTAVIAMVWRACWSSALPVDSIVRIGCALAHYAPQAEERMKPDLHKALSAMVRAKVLRTRRDRGRTLYEVNF
jgi:hypothetical protein